MGVLPTTVALPSTNIYYKRYTEAAAQRILHFCSGTLLKQIATILFVTVVTFFIMCFYSTTNSYDQY